MFFNHIGDTYTDIQTYIDDATTPTAGKSWRWCRCDNSGGVLASLSCGYVKSRDWYKIGRIPLRAYYYIRCHVGGYEYQAYHFSYDSAVQVVGGPPVYIKVDSTTGDVYVYDNHGYLDSQTSKYEFLDENSQFIEAKDKEGNTVRLHWHQIADSDAVKALLEASKAHTAADGKSRIFVNTPTPPYKEGDLWVQGSTGDIMRCKDGVNMTSGSYSASDWEVASKYTDDKVANEAKAIANAASSRLSLWAQDNVISPPEKQGIKDEYAFVVADKNDIDTKADKCGDITSDLVYIIFNNACQVYVGMLYDIIQSSAENVSIPKGMSLAQSEYYSARTDILNAIAEWERQEVEELYDLASSIEETVNDREYLSKTFDKLADIDRCIEEGVIPEPNKMECMFCEFKQLCAKVEEELNGEQE